MSPRNGDKLKEGESGKSPQQILDRETDPNSGEALTHMTCDVSCEYVHSFAGENSVRIRGVTIPLFTDSNSVSGSVSRSVGIITTLRMLRFHFLVGTNPDPELQ